MYSLRGVAEFGGGRTQNRKTNKEYDLLLYLVQNRNIALYRETLYEKVWEQEGVEETRTLDLHIQRLRKKLNWHNYIQTVYKIGYLLEVK